MIWKWIASLGLAVCVYVLAINGLTGCNTFGGGSQGNTFIDSVFSPDQKQAEERLREIIREYIQTEHAVADKQSAPVIKRRPYYFKEYSVFPDGNDVFTVDFREIDSRIRSLMAEVKINKVRYSTRMHRKQHLAVSDMDFLRDTGVETLVFELRSGRWMRTGAIFDAEKTEEFINGEWIPRREETERVIPAEDRPGWFKRVWMRIRGGKE